MENPGLTAVRASFTVEAAVVMSIVIWVILSICYFSMYLHDRTIICSEAKDALSVMVKREGDETAAGWEKELAECLDRKFLLCQIEDVSVKKNVLSVEADIHFSACVTFPLVENLLRKDREIHIEQETIVPPCYMWDSDVAGKAVK